MSYRITLSLGLVLIVAGYFVLRRLLRGRIVLSLSNLTWTKVGCIYFAIGKNLNNRVPRNLSTGNRKESSVEPDVKNVYQNAIFAILIRSIEINVIRKLCMLQITAEFFEIFLSPSSKFSTASNFKRAKEPKCVNVSPKGSKSSFNLWVERVINAAVEWISSKFGIEIDYLNFIFTQIPTDLEINAYTVIEMRIESLCLYGIKSFKYFKCKKVSGKEVIETTGTLSQNEEPFSDKLQAVNFSILSVKSIKSFDISIIIDCQTAVVFSEKEVLQIPDLKIDFGWSIDDCIHKITLSSSEIKANVFSTTLLFLNSAVADITGAAFKYVDFDNSTDQAEKFKTSNNQKVNFKESDCDFKIFGFKFVSAAIQISIPAVSLNFHLPSNDEKPEYERFSRITIALDRINLFCRYDWGQVLPMLLLRLRGAKISSVSSGVIGTDNYSVVDRLMQNNLDIFPSMAGFKEEVLLCVSEGLATTCWPVDSTAPSVIAYDKAVDWTRSFISTGKPIWSHNNSSDDETSFDEHINQRRSKIDTWFTIDEEIESGTNPFISRQFKQISDNTIMAKVQSVSFDLPFEYPLSNLLWHLKYYIRTCKMASSKQYYAQIKAFEQNLLSFDGLAKYFGYALVPWRLYIFGSDGRFSIGDDKFEILLARSLRAKRATQLRISKIEGLFWKRVYQERVAKQTFSQEHDLPKKEPVPAIARSGSFFGRFKKTPSVENISLNTKPNQIPVIVDKSRPILRFSLLLEEERGLEQIRHCPDLFRKYEKMQKYCFSIYKESFMKYEQYAPEKPLLYAGAQDIHFTALWSPSFVYRAVDSDQEGNKQEENSTYGFSALLNAMDPSAMFNELELSEIELLIGAFLDARASNLCVRLRDYVVPLVSVGEVNGCGMAFIVEEAPRSEDMAVADLQIMRPKMRSWNMRPLPRDGLARLGFSIAPVKIYHSIHLRSPSSSLVTQVNPCYLSNGVGVLSGISLIHEGIFEMLNRSFDLFSRPSEDPSPQLPPWDKVRMILHGNTTSFKVNSKLRFVFLGGRDLWSCDDFLGIDVAPGLFVSLGGQEAGLFTFRIPSLCASSFNSDTLFMWHHRAIGHPFSISDKLYTCQQPDSKQERIVNQQMIDPSVQENLPNTGFNETQFKFDSALGLNARLTRFGIVLVESPPITVEIRVELTGFRGRPLLPHRKIHLIAPSSFAAVEKGGISKFSDSFHHFRTNSISLRIVVRGENCEFATLESGQTPVLHLNHYRELEEWIDKVFVRAALNFSRVKSGSIFKSGVLALVPSRGLGTVLRDIQIDVGYAGETLARMLNYYSLIEKEVRSETYGGIMVSSSGKANVRLIFRRSRRERRPIDRNSSSATFQSDIGSPDNSKDVSPANLPAWNMHFLKLDLAKSQISVVGPYKVDDSEAPTANFELVSRFVIPMSRHMISKSGSITYSDKSVPALYRVIETPRVYWMTVGLSAFRYDTESFIIQQQEILRIVNELKDLVSKETLTDKDEVGILRDQIDNLRTCIFEDKSTSESARDILEGSEMSNYHSQKPNSDDVFYVNRNFASFPNARGIWYQDLRNTLLSFIEQQFHLSRLRSAVMASSTKNIGVNLSNLNASKMEFSNSNKDAETDFTPLSPNSLADMMQSLLGDEKSESNGDTGTIRKTFDARCEDPESKISNNRFRNHYDDPMLFGSLSELVNLVQDPLSRIMETFEIKVQSPSVVLVDSTGRSAAILLTSREASISIGSVGLCSSADGKTAEDLTDKSTIKVVGVVDFNSENDYSEHTIAGKRIKVIIDAAQLEVGSALTVMDRTEKDFVRVASDPKLSQKKSEDESHVIANNLNLAIVCDMDYTENHKRDPSSLKTRQSSQSHTISKATVYSIFSGGAKIHIATKNGISLCTDSEEYATLFDVIVNLLVYDDEIKACRKAKLESLMFLATISDPNRLKRTVESMQKKLLMTLLKFNRMAKRQLRTVKSDTKFFKECHVSDNNNRFNFEVIDECNISGQAEKLWRKISDRWDELGLVIAALRSASTAAASRLTGNKKEKTLLDASIPFLNWTISMPAEKMSKFSKSNSKTDIKEAKSMGTMASGNTVPAFEIKVQGFRDIFISSADSSTTNLIEIESFRGMNLIPTSFYRIFAEPISNRRGNQNILDTIMTKTYQQDCVLRVYMRSLPPVAGIRIFEQLEINVSPLRIQLNHDMGLQLLKFFLPRSSATIAKDPNEKSPKSLNLSLMTSNSSVKISDRNQNNNYDSTLDAEFTNLFRQRAAENCSFLYVRFPASYHVLSFKGEGGGKLIDIENFSLKIPDFRYNALVMSPRKLAMKILWDAVGPIAGNVGALIRDKIQRIGKQMKPDSSAIEENDDQEVLLEVAPVVKDETQEDRDRKAWLLLGKSFSKNKN